jgi:hypothetical protein
MSVDTVRRVGFPNLEQRERPFPSRSCGKSTDPLDWSLDWKEILDTRWEKRNPGKKFY